MVVSARELAERERKRLEVKKATYRAILEQFSRKISNAAALGQRELFLTTPRFIVGFPAYDILVATQYIQRQLDRLGYQTRRTMPMVIHVSWAKPEPTARSIIIDHTNDEELPSLANLAKAAQKIRATARPK